LATSVHGKTGGSVQGAVVDRGVWSRIRPVRPAWRGEGEPTVSESEHSQAAEIVEVCRWMYDKGFITSTEGNVSAQLAPDRILTTPRGVHKGFLTPDQLVMTDLDGRRVSGDFSPSSELQLHLLVYHERPDVAAVVHAHPTMAIVCSLAGIPLTSGVIPEVVTSLGAIPTAPYATPGTTEAAWAIKDLIHQFDAIILERHGSVTVGRNLREAYLKLEMLEHSAQILFLTRLLGPLSPLPKDEVARLLVTGGRTPSNGPSGSPRPRALRRNSPRSDGLKNPVTS
jgi:L-fuculose-phosphate aldolase